jgi:hypothetical protein
MPNLHAAFDAYLDSPPSLEGWHRALCPTCGLMRKRYCPKCLTFIEPPIQVQRMHLPINIKVLFAEDR